VGGANQRWDVEALIAKHDAQRWMRLNLVRPALIKQYYRVAGKFFSIASANDHLILST
jgi:hypothetical protein